MTVKKIRLNFKTEYYSWRNISAFKYKASLNQETKITLKIDHTSTACM